MKNKKLFAILTLVCFMMTLMPVAAFADVDADTSYIYTVKENPTVKLSDENEELEVVLMEKMERWEYLNNIYEESLKK